MSLGIGLVVLTAALMRGLWNALVKGSGDKTVILGCIALVLFANSVAPLGTIWFREGPRNQRMITVPR
ncbi:MAG: hypothetical protein GY952_01185 [Rhodobacteraceae bacterium]|nr:hypothetical protein [Paracoccaceae bacterium]